MVDESAELGHSAPVGWVEQDGRMARRICSAMLGAALCLAACGDDDAASERADADSEGGASSLDAGLNDRDAALLPPPLDAQPAQLPRDAGSKRDASSGLRPPPTNFSFEAAKRVEPDGLSVLQDELSADQVD